MTNDLASLISQYGLAIVFANVLVEQIGVPVPAIPTLMVAGALAVSGRLSLVAVFAVARVHDAGLDAHGLEQAAHEPNHRGVIVGDEKGGGLSHARSS